VASCHYDCNIIADPPPGNLDSAVVVVEIATEARSCVAPPRADAFVLRLTASAPNLIDRFLVSSEEILLLLSGTTLKIAAPSIARRG
jgi:hypothetical protein